MKQLADVEASRLSIYFEELARYHQKQMRESQSSSSTRSTDTETVIELGDEEEE